MTEPTPDFLAALTGVALAPDAVHGNGHSTVGLQTRQGGFSVLGFRAYRAAGLGVLRCPIFTLSMEGKVH